MSESKDPSTTSTTNSKKVTDSRSISPCELSDLGEACLSISSPFRAGPKDEEGDGRSSVITIPSVRPPAANTPAMNAGNSLLRAINSGADARNDLFRMGDINPSIEGGIIPQQQPRHQQQNINNHGTVATGTTSSTNDGNSFVPSATDKDNSGDPIIRGGWRWWQARFRQSTRKVSLLEDHYIDPRVLDHMRLRPATSTNDDENDCKMPPTSPQSAMSNKSSTKPTDNNNKTDEDEDMAPLNDLGAAGKAFMNQKDALFVLELLGPMEEDGTATSTSATAVTSKKPVSSKNKNKKRKTNISKKKKEATKSQRVLHVPSDRGYHQSTGHQS